jgi:quinone-modifying oxidoreductase, subunit QmoB
MSTKHSPEVESNTRISSPLPRALVLGGGIPALVAAQALREMGADVTFARIQHVPSHDYLALPGPRADYGLSAFGAKLDGVAVIDVDQALVVRREAGGFHSSFENGLEKFYDCVLLSPGVSLRAKQTSLPENTELFTSHIPFKSTERIAFLLDFEQPSDPALGVRAMKESSLHAINGGASVVYFRHAPVTHLFGETLYDEARKAGVRFVRFGDELPVVSHLRDRERPALFRITARDVIDYDEQYVFDCDRVLVVTGPDASSIPQWAIEMLARRDVDGQGFALSESVHCNSGCSFTSGVFIVGEAAGNLDLIGLIAQAKAAAAKAYSWMRTSRAQINDQPISISSACVGCLTCYRVCPHGALSIKPGLSRPIIDPRPSLCRSCGICASVCPSLAITINTSPEDCLLAAVNEVPGADMHKTTFVFRCRRSAGRLERSVQLPEHVRFLEVPCAGRVSEYVIWHALAAGAKGVLVVGCHHGNCASDAGTNFAAARIEEALATGLFRQGRRRVGYETVAANEHARFQRLLREFTAEAPGETLE